MPDKICPCCGVIKIEEWETVCNSCYRLVGELDYKFGTEYQKMIKEGKFILIQNVTIKQVGIFYPISHVERMMRVKRVASHCVNCQMHIQKGCEECIWHKLMNSISGVEPW